MSLLEVNDLSVEYQTKGETIRAVDGISFDIDETERFGLVGESGCGKTTIAESVLRLLPDNGSVVGGEILYDGVNLLELSEREFRERRWDDISQISQSAMNALDPVYTVEEQIGEAIEIHEDVEESEISERAAELVSRVGLDDERLDAYPHQLSGGMRQRVMIAMAMALDPSLIIADEPTTALDVITQDHILGQIDQVVDRLRTSLFMITHDISVVRETCDTVGVMYAGRLVESGPVEEVFNDPEHPYTQGLLHAFPTIEGAVSELVTILGQPPDLQERPPGCAFAERCPYAEQKCRETQPELSPRAGASDHRAACFITERNDDISHRFTEVMEETDKWQRL